MLYLKFQTSNPVIFGYRCFICCYTPFQVLFSVTIDIITYLIQSARGVWTAEPTFRRGQMAHA